MREAPDPAKVAERRAELLRRLDSNERDLAGALAQASGRYRVSLEQQRRLILHELEAMEPKPEQPSEVEVLRAEVERLTREK